MRTYKYLCKLQISVVLFKNLEFTILYSAQNLQVQIDEILFLRVFLTISWYLEGLNGWEAIFIDGLRWRAVAGVAILICDYEINKNYFYLEKIEN
jgi:hypothetical protein